MSERGLRSTKAPDAAVVLPLFGVFLLMPPIISLFAVPLAFGGVPLVILYLFGIWAALIVCTALLARRLDGADQALPPTETSVDAGDHTV